MTNLKKILASLTFVAFGAVACISCAQKAPPSVAPPPVATASAPVPVVASAAPTPPADSSSPDVPQPGSTDPVVVTADNVTFTLPGGDVWHKVQSNSDTMLAVYRNVSTKSTLILAKDEFTGNTQAATIMILRAAKDAGITVTSVKQATISGVKYVVIVGHMNVTQVTTWLLANKGYVYDFSCGGPMDSKDVTIACNTIASSLKIQ